MNIYDISEKAGVSTATVSRVLNNSENVSDKTRKKVLAVMEETGFQPNIFARGLGLNSMSTIGILCMDSSDMYMASAIYHIEQGLRKEGYDCLLCCTGYHLEDRNHYMNLLVSKGLDALVLVGSAFTEEDEEKNTCILEVSQQLPIVLLGGHLEGERIYGVSCDDATAMRRITNQVISSCGTQILFLNRSQSYCGMMKRSGFVSAYADHGEVVESWQIQPLDEETEGVISFLEEMQTQHPFRAVVCSDDKLAVGVLKYAKKHNLSVPEDLSVTGYNNSTHSHICEPELTSVDNKLEYSCGQVVSLLMSVLKEEDVPHQMVISAEIIQRDTTLF